MYMEKSGGKVWLDIGWLDVNSMTGRHNGWGQMSPLKMWCRERVTRYKSQVKKDTKRNRLNKQVPKN